MKPRQIFMTLVLLLGGLLGSIALTAPAQAADPYTWVCNSSASDEWIRAYNVNRVTLGRDLGPNGCTATGDWYTPVSYVRVDVDMTGENSYGVDIDSYKIGEIDVGYGPCHVGENGDSNPPDSYADNGIRYRNYRNSSCS